MFAWRSSRPRRESIVVRYAPIPVELVAPAPAAIVGQCRLMHAFPSDILHNSSRAAEDIACCMADFSWEEAENYRRKTREILRVPENYCMRTHDERVISRYFWYRRVLRRKRIMPSAT